MPCARIAGSSAVRSFSSTIAVLIRARSRAPGTPYPDSSGVSDGGEGRRVAAGSEQAREQYENQTHGIHLTKRRPGRLRDGAAPARKCLADQKRSLAPSRKIRGGTKASTLPKGAARKALGVRDRVDVERVEDVELERHRAQRTERQIVGGPQIQHVGRVPVLRVPLAGERPHVALVQAAPQSGRGVHGPGEVVARDVLVEPAEGQPEVGLVGAQASSPGTASSSRRGCR